jgi:hypothetical protein
MKRRNDTDDEQAANTDNTCAAPLLRRTSEWRPQLPPKAHNRNCPDVFLNESEQPATLKKPPFGLVTPTERHPPVNRNQPSPPPLAMPQEQFPSISQWPMKKVLQSQWIS